MGPGALAAYVGRRILASCLLVFVVASGSLLLVRLVPGDATTELVAERAGPEVIARERARLGLDRPVASQYLDWVARAARLDLGVSWRYGRPVRGLVAEREANTAALALAALAVATLVGIPLGVWTGSRRGGFLPGVARTMSIAGLSVPPLVLALLVVLIAARAGWPVGGMQSVGAAELPWIGRLADFARHLVGSMIALSLPLAALLERLQAQAMAEALRQPFILAAMARGIPPRRLIWCHAWPHAIKPVAAVFGIVAGSLMSGSFAVEIVTAWPGLGRLTFDALLARDLYLVAGCATAGSVFLAIGTLVGDLATLAVDPRVREAQS